MEQYVKQEIMEQSRHQFIYGYNGEKREQFLKALEDDYPIQVDCNVPMAIYLDEWGLPKVPINNNSLDKSKVCTLASQYLTFTIAYNILVKSMNNINIDFLNSRIRYLVSLLDLNNDFDGFIDIVKQSRDFYFQYYIDYVRDGEEKLSMDDLILPFLDLNFFITYFKEALNNNSYFGIIVDKQCEVANISVQAINFLIGSRINSDISMKIAVEPDSWDTYFDLNGQFVESVHDYGIVELDNSLSKHIKKLKRF